MRKTLKKAAMLMAPVLAAISLIGLSQTADPVSEAAWKALTVFSVLGCLSTVANGAGRTHVELGAMHGVDLRDKGREAA